MKENLPSRTAQRVALARAVHQILDHPRVFEDPLALRIAGIRNESADRIDPEYSPQTPFETRLRAFLVARSRCAEDELHLAVERGVRQYVVLGAGLDTFAYRNPYPEAVLRVFEVDHPNTQAWKRSCLEQAGIEIPSTLTFSPIDFETVTLEEGLRRAGFDTSQCAFFSWLGVTPYLTITAVNYTFQFVASLPAGSGIAFDYAISPELLDPVHRQAFDHLAQRVARAGEPFQTFFDPLELKNRLLVMGFGEVEDLGHDELNARYFHGRTDNLRIGGRSGRVMIARV